MDWLKDIETGKAGETVEALRRLSELDEDELEGIGRALSNLGGFENGLKLFKTYFRTFELEQYGKNIFEVTKKVFLRHVAEDGTPALEAWSSAIGNGWIAARCSGERVYPKVPEDLARAYGFKGGELFTVIVRRGDEEYWVAGRLQEASTYVGPHERMFSNLGLEKGEYVELIPGKVDGASLFPALGEGKTRVEYHFSHEWNSPDGALIQQKGGEGVYLTGLRKIGYLDEHGAFHVEPGETHYYLRNVELGHKLEFDVDEASTKNYMPVYEVKLGKIGYVELSEALKPLLKKGWVTYDVDTGRARLVGFPGLKAIGFEYEGKNRGG